MSVFFQALIATVTFISTNPTTASAAEQISLHKINQHNQLMPMHSLTQMLVLKLILQHNQLPANQGQPAAQPANQGGQANPAGGAAQPAGGAAQPAAGTAQPAGQGNQAIEITLHKHNLEIKQHRQTKQDKEITKQHRQIKHSQRMLQQQRNQQHL